jgi:hypothetical protein
MRRNSIVRCGVAVRVRAEAEKGKDACQICPVYRPFVCAAGEARPGVSKHQARV